MALILPASALYTSLELAARQPKHADQVQCGADGAFGAIDLADSGVAWAMVDRDFARLVAGGAGQGWDEAVHAVPRGQLLGQVAAQDLERATGIAGAIVEERGANGVSQARTEVAPPIVAAIGANAGDEVEGIALEFLEKLGRVGGIVLQIGIEQDDKFALGGLHAVIHRCALAAVTGQIDPTDGKSRAGGGLLVLVGAGVVDENDFRAAFDGLGETPQHRIEFTDEIRKIAALVVERYDDGKTRWLVHSIGGLFAVLSEEVA